MRDIIAERRTVQQRAERAKPLAEHGGRRLKNKRIKVAYLPLLARNATPIPVPVQNPPAAGRRRVSAHP